MTIGVKYWNPGASVPGSWTSVDVAQCYPRLVTESYDEDTALDGTKVNWRLQRYRITIVFGKKAMNNATTRGYIDTLCDSYYVRVNDSRFGWLETGDSVNFVHVGNAEPGRDRAALLTEDLTIELVSESVV